MNVGCGANTSHGSANDQKCIESGGYHLIHHSQNHPMSSKSIVRITLLFIAAAVACLAIYHSAHRIQYFFPTSYNPFSTSISHEFTKSNQFSSPSDHPASGNFSSLPDDSSQGNLSFSTSDHPIRGNFSSPPDDPSLGNLSKSSNIDSSSNPSNSSSPTTTNTAQENFPLPVNEENEETKLDKVLNEAAIMNKTVILAPLNAAWTEPSSIFDLFLESFQIGDETKKFLNHLVVIALDQKAYSRCLELHHHCYALATEGVDFSGEAIFMTEVYLKMTWRKVEFMLTVLKMGYNFIFTDGDILWFRDPFLHLHKDADFQIASDHYAGDPTSPSSEANTGFYYVESNNQTIQFYEFWLASKEKFPDIHDQDAFNMIKTDPFVEKIGFKLKFLDTAFYGGFCEQSQDLNLVCTMHANCCVGLGNKLHDLNMLIEDWKKYMALPNDEKIRVPQTWTLPRICG